MWKIRFAIIFAFLALAVIGIRFDDEFNDLDSNIDAEGSGSDSSTSSPGGCEDESSDCASSVSECNNTMYKPLMCGLCKKTCKLCPEDNNGGDPCAGITPVTLPPSTPAPGVCEDVDSNCGSDVSECTNPMYIPLMCKYCRVSHFEFIKHC